MVRKIILAGAIAALVGAAPATAQSAQQSAVEVPTRSSDVYDTLIGVIVQGIDADAVTERMLSQMRNAMMSEAPTLSAFEKDHPGSVRQIVEAMRPIMQRHAERISAQHRSELHDLFQAELSEADASDAAAFYSSPLGRRVLEAVSGTITQAAALREAVSSEGPTSADAIQADHAASTRLAVAALTPAELAGIEHSLRGKAWVMQMQLMRSSMLEINTRIENIPFNAEDEAAINAVVTTIMEKRLAED